MRARGFASILILLLLSPPLWGYPLSRTIEMIPQDMPLWILKP